MPPINHPADIPEVSLDGHHLEVAEIVAVARYRARVRLGDEARRRVACGRAVVDRLIEAGAKVYGLTTGFGSKRDILIDPEELEQLQINLIRSHACGVGEALAEDEVRAAMLLRANTLARGYSGVRPEVIDALVAFLNRDVYPWIPSRGSLGASGDLAPLSHLALALCNDPAARFYRSGHDEPKPAGPRTADGSEPDYIEEPASWRFGPPPPDLFGPGGLVPLALQAKEGLALNNGTQVSVAIGILTLFDANLTLESAELVTSLSIEAIKGVRDAFDPRLQAARPLAGQAEAAANILSYTDGSQVLTLPINTARLHRARRAITGAEENLAPGHQALAERARRLGTELVALEERVMTVAPAPGGNGETPSARRLRFQRAYREALAPLRGEVLGLYAAVLEADLSGEGVKGRDFLADAVSQLQLALPETPSVQDDYSFRCAPQVLGAIRHVVAETWKTLENEANSATDNPLIFPPDLDGFTGTPAEYAAALDTDACRDAVVSGGNFHGEPVAIALDHLAIGLAELGNISERRSAHLVDGHLSNGLPSLLVWKSGLNNGLMIPQYVAASLVSENKVLAHPASVDSIPSCENTEDHVSMSALAALKCRQILKNVETVVAVELLTAWQGVYYRRPLACGRATERLWQSMLEEGMTPVLSDRVLYLDMEWSRRFLRDGKVWRITRDHVLDSSAPPKED